MSHWKKWFEENIGGKASFVNYIQEIWIYNKDLFYDIIGNRIKPPQEVLEIGCGTALEILAPLSANGLKVTGIDKEKDMVEFAKHNFKKLGLKGHFIHHDLFKYNTHKKFDLVLSVGLIEHFPRRKIVEIIKIHKKLSKKWVVFIVPTKHQRHNKKHRGVKDPNWVDLSFKDLSSISKKSGLKFVSKIAYGDIIRSDYVPPVISKIIRETGYAYTIGLICRI
tara:strand:- start:1097 stop:1762 length:666 start_codon:yes stop_codon:yes gene_type:complete